MSEGVLDDATMSPAPDFVNIAAVPERDMASTLMMSSVDDAMVMATSADDLSESHVVMQQGDDVMMMMSNHDV